MKSSLLRTREKFRQQRQTAESAIRLRGNLEAANYQLRNARNEVERLKNRLARVTSSTIDRDPLSRHINFCVRIDQRNLERDREAVIEEAMRQLANDIRKQGI